MSEHWRAFIRVFVLAMLLLTVVFMVFVLMNNPDSASVERIVLPSVLALLSGVAILIKDLV